MKHHLYNLLAVFGAYTAVSLIVTPLIGRWIERHSQPDDQPARTILVPVGRTNRSYPSSTQRLRERTHLERVDGHG